MRSPMIVANWKMNLDFGSGLRLAQTLFRQQQAQRLTTVPVVLMPAYIHLEAISACLPSTGNIYLGAQHCHDQPSGAYTGAISVPMLCSVGVRFVLVGHSECRQQWGETEALLAQKTSMILSHGLRPIFCCGEPQVIREADQAIPFVQQQLAAGLFHLTAREMAQVVLAYEPVWAIGTNHVPTQTQVQTMHQAMRAFIAQQYGQDCAERIPILYGGSCNAQNAATFFDCPAVDGGLIGRAALQPDTLIAIVKALHKSSNTP